MTRIRCCVRRALIILWFFAAAPATSPAQTFDVRAFGAAGDGLQDDLPAVRRALAAAAEGGTVRFPAGTYRWSGTLRISTDGVTLQGEPGAVVSAAAAVQRLLIVDGVDRFRMRGLAFEGKGDGTRGITIQLRECTDCEISGNRFDRIGTSTIDVTEGSERCRIVGNTIRHSPGHSIMISGWASETDPSRGSRHVDVHDNFLYRPGNTGISVEVGNRHISVRGNRVIGANRNRQTYSYGIAVFNGTSDYEIIDNLVAATEPVPGTNDTGNGILIGQGENHRPATRGRIAGNLLIGNGRIGGHGPEDCAPDTCEGNGILVAFPDATGSEIDTVIEDNLVLGSGRSGISLADARNVTVRNNVILASGNQGIWLREGAGGNYVIRNLVERSANHGIRVESAWNLVSLNRSRGNGLSGIYLGGTARHNHVERNFVWGNDRARFGHAGVFLDGDEGAGASYNEVVENRYQGEPAAARRQEFDLRIRSAGCRDNLLTGSFEHPDRIEDRGEGTRSRDVTAAGVRHEPPPETPTAALPCDQAGTALSATPSGCHWSLLKDRHLRLPDCGSGDGARFLHLACTFQGGVEIEPGNAPFLSGQFACSPGNTLTLACRAGRWHEVDRHPAPQPDSGADRGTRR